MAPALIAIALEIARHAAPKIIGHLAGDKAEEVAERVVDMAQEITGTATPELALAKIKADPNLAMQLNIRAQEIEADLDKAFLADRASARARDIEFLKAGQSNTRANWMIVGDVVGLLACLAAMVYTTWLGVQGSIGAKDVSPIIMALNGPLGMLTQQFANGLRDAHQFEFGSSRGSREKDAALASVTKV